MITFGSICSGIEAASVAWSVMPWKAVWLAEIEKAPSEILAAHYPDVPNLGDMMTIQGRLQRREIPAPDILVGGTPCQSFSVAGLRGGLSDDRGALTLEFIKIANQIDEQRDTETKCVIVWENVPGVLTSKDNAFGCFLAGLAGEDQPLQPSGKKWSNSGCVFGPQRTIAWRVLDAQYFGLAQRRKRVFVVASARTGFDPAAVLLEFDGLRRDSAPKRNQKQEISTASVCGIKTSSEFDHNGLQHIVGTLCADTHPGAYSGQDAYTGRLVPVVHGTQDPCTQKNLAFALGRNSGQENVIFHVDVMPTMVSGGSTPGSKGRMSGQFTEGYLVPTSNLKVRRLMPVECERLQGFPDGYTAITVRGKPLADGPRYKALGNSMAVTVMRWLGLRIWMMLTTRTGRLPGTKEQS